MWKLFLSLWVCLLGFGFSQTTLEPTFVTLEPTPNTPPPTAKPTHGPTLEPTAYPVVSIESGYVITISANVIIARLDSSEILSELAYFELLFADAAGLDSNEVDISVVSVADTVDTSLCNGTGVNVGYDIISDDNSTYSDVRRSIDTGTFVTSYDAGLSNIFSESVFVCGNNSIIGSFETEKYGKVYPPSPSPSLTEDLWSEYLFFGFFTSLLGVVWLWYLRSDVDDDNIYVNKTGDTQSHKGGNGNGATGNGGSNGVEMTGQGSDPSGNSSNALLDDDGTAKGTGGGAPAGGAPRGVGGASTSADTATGDSDKLSDYAVKTDDGKLILDQRDSKRSP